jgi:hypothetical protein
MRRTFYGVVAVAAVALFIVSGAAASMSGVTSNGFETNTAGWFNNDGTITRQQGAPSSYVNPGGYAVGIPAAAGSYYAALDRGPCSTQVGGGGDTVYCSGPFTDWGDSTRANWNGPYQTQVDIYLDTAYANANPDTYGGNLTGLSSTSPYTGDGTNPANIGTRFDFTSAINNNTGGFLRDFGFNVSTGYAGDSCNGFVVDAGTNVNRTGANPNVSSTAQCISTTGWYTFKNSFSSKNGYLDVLMTITPVGSTTPVASWDITKGSPNYANGDADGTYGCARYGWFSDQEIYGLPIDNASISGGCVAPTITGGQILETGTTCQAYTGHTATTLGQVLYTLKGGKINSVSPGVFFYYGTISGTAGQTFTIGQTSSPTGAPVIPVQHGQVILYDTSCNKLKWTDSSDTNGVVTGTLPSTGTFIISVKYNPAALSGDASPGTVTYTIDGGATVTLAPK